MHIYINKNYLYKSLVFFVALATSALVYADPTAFIYQGQIIKPDTTPLESNPVSFTIQIFSSNADNCLLYEETHSVDMTGSGGLFSLPVGSGSQAGVSFEDTSSLNTVINNNGVVMTPVSCATAATSYTSVTGDSRRLRLTFDDGSGPITLSQDHNIQSVPYANYASRLGGLEKSDFIQANGGAGFELTQANINSLFTTANHGELLALIGGTSTQYAKTNPTGAVSFNNQKIEDVATPTVGTDAANKNYVDANIGGSVLDVAGVGPASGDGRVLTWDQANNKWVTAAANTTDATKLPLAGGAMTGNITMGGNQILGTGHITQAAQSTVTIGAYTTAQQTTLVGGLTAANAGAMWFNSTTGKLMWWDGSTSGEVADSAVASGDITEVNTNVGSGLSGGVTNGAATVQVVVDNASVEIATNTIQVKDGGITNAKIATVSVGKITSGATEYFGYMPAGTECLNNQVLKWNSVNDRWLCASDADGGLTSLNGLTGGTQTFGAPGSAGTAPAWVSSGTTHTMNIPLASGAGVTSGTISKTDYDAFSAKQGTALANTNIRVGNAGGVATAVSMSGDATIANTGAVTIANNVITTVKILDANVTDAKIAAVGVDKITSGGTKYFSYMPAGTECGNNEILKWDATNDRWLCAADGGVSDHGALSGLGDDDHTQYVLLAGRAGGQLLTGGTAASEDLILESTSHGTKGDIILNATGGNVGIGTTTPSTKLNISGVEDTIFSSGNPVANEGMRLRITNGSTVVGSYAGIDLGTRFGSAGMVRLTAINNGEHKTHLAFSTENSSVSERMRITDTGNVGIGTTAPTKKLVVDSTSDVTGGFQLAGVLSNPWIRAPSTGGLGIGFAARPDDVFINNSGSVGIGTTAPTEKLEVFDGNLRIYKNITGGNSRINLGHVDGASDFTLGNAVGARFYIKNQAEAGFGTGGDFISYTEGANLKLMGGVDIDPSGNVGIGTTSPAVELDVDDGVINASAICDESNSNCIDLSSGVTTSSNSEAGANAGNYIINTDSDNAGSDGGVDIQTNGSTVASITSSGNIQSTSGAATTPGLSFTGDTNTGLFNPAADTLSMAAGGVEALRLNTVASGVNYVEVTPAAAGNGPIISTDGADTNIDLNITPKGTGNTVFTNGNVGIGTTDPAVKLVVTGVVRSSASGGGQLDFKRNSVLSGSGYLGASVFYDNTNTEAGRIFMADGSLTGATLSRMGFSTGGNNERMTISSTGNVGIGTTAPTVKLDVRGQIKAEEVAGNQAYIGGNAAGGYLALYNDSGNSMFLQYDDSDNIYFANVTGDTIFQSGNVGIGTTSPAVELDVNTGTINAASICDENNANCLDLSAGVGGGDFFKDGSVAMTGAFLAEANGVTPTITFDGDTNTGFMYGPSTDNFKVVAGGTTLMQFNSVRTYDPTSGGFALTRAANSAATPPYSFNGDFDSGLFRASADQIGLSTAATERMRIDASGNVGIGTTTPSGKLDIEGGDVFIGTGTLTNGTAGDDLNVTGNVEAAAFYGDGSNLTGVTASPAGANTQIQFNNSAAMGADSNLVWDNVNKRLGIGGAPSTVLQVQKDSTSDIEISMNNPNTAANAGSQLSLNSDIYETKLMQRPSTSYAGGWLESNSTRLHLVNSHASGAIRFMTGTSYSNRMTIDSSGNVGVGTTAPAVNLHVASSVVDSNVWLATENDAQQWLFGVRGDSSDSFQIVDNTGGTDPRLVIDSSGNVGVGTTTPGHKLVVQGTTWDNDTGADLQVRGTGGGGGVTLIPTNSASNEEGWSMYAGGPGAWVSDGNLGFVAHKDGGGTTSSDVKMVLQRSGNVGIGTTSPAVELDVNTGTINAAAICDENNANCLDLSAGVGGSGDFLADGSVPMTGQLDFLGGSAAAPGISPSGVPDAGIYSSGADTIGFSTGGTKRLSITSVGQVYVGNYTGAGTPFAVAATSPLVSLQDTNATGATTMAGGIQLRDSAGTLFGFLGDHSVSSSDLLVKGTTVPVNITTTGANEIKFETNSTERMRVDSTGNVGVGTTSPASKLHVDGSGAGGGVCVTSDGTCSAVPTGGQISAETTLNTGADYAEYFYSEEEMKSGDLVGLHASTGKVRRYRAGDHLLGLVSTEPGVIGNSKLMKEDGVVLVALVGQVPFNPEQVTLSAGNVQTKDGKVIGQLLFDGKVYVNISSVDQAQDKQIAQIKKENSALKKQNHKLESDVRSLKQRLEKIEKALRLPASQ